jgi:hypothetical protein
MNGATYEFASTAQFQLTMLFGFPNLKTPRIHVAGPAIIERSDSSSPAPGRFLATTRIKEMNMYLNNSRPLEDGEVFFC